MFTKRKRKRPAETREMEYKGRAHIIYRNLFVSS